jgi:DNA-binding LacI/PurR family transcriptional regulator
VGNNQRLRGGGESMSDQGASIGLVIRHGHDRDPVADTIVRAIAGPLLGADLRFVTRSVDDEESELRTYRLWARVGGVAGVILLGAVEDDPRIRLLRQIDMPFVALVRSSTEVDYPSVVIDESAASTVLTAYLETCAATRWVYITSQQTPESIVGDSETSDQDGDHRALEIVQTEDVVAESLKIALGTTDSTPAALIFDSDRDAVSALESLEANGVAVPEQVALICWSDSLVCQSASRPITAIDRRGREIGELLGTAAITAISEDGFGTVAAPAPAVVVREST